MLKTCKYTLRYMNIGEKKKLRVPNLFTIFELKMTEEIFSTLSDNKCLKDIDQ